MKSIVLVVGYTDKQNVTHRDVEIGKRLRGADVFAIDDDPQSALPANYQSLILSRAITKFGLLRMPVPLSVLLALDSIDRDDLIEACNALDAEGSDGRKFEVLADNKVRLANGLDLDGVVYDVAEFGHRITGYDYVAAEKEGLADARKAFFLIGRQIVRLSQSDGQAVLDGPFDLDTLERFYARDLYALRQGAELFRQSFRRPRKAVQAGAGSDSVRADEGDGSKRS